MLLPPEESPTCLLGSEWTSSLSEVGDANPESVCKSSGFYRNWTGVEPVWSCSTWGGVPLRGIAPGRAYEDGFKLSTLTLAINKDMAKKNYIFVEKIFYVY